MSHPIADEALTAEQRRVVRCREGALLVLAPAGSGKTLAMTERLAAALAGGLDPDRALCVTFTHRAAREMRRRVEERLGAKARGVHVRTFHALCAWILRHEAPRLGLPRDFGVWDEEDARELLRRLLRQDRALEHLSAADVFHEIGARKSSAPAGFLSLDRLARHPPLELDAPPGPLARLVRRYHEHLAEYRVLDFADLVYRVRSLFHLLPSLRRTWGRRFEWIQVDEVQDTHDSEYDVLRVLARGSGNLALFGDFDQTIYGWRGSDPAGLVARFEEDFGPVERLTLSRNFRATKALLAAADRIAANLERRCTSIVPDPGLPAGEPPSVRAFPGPDEEARFVAGRIAALRKRRPSTRIAVLARSHRRLAPLADRLPALGVDVFTAESAEFFRRQEIKDALARLRLLVQPADSTAAARILQRPPSGIGEGTLAKLREGASAGLRLVDLFRRETHERGEPFAALLSAVAEERFVVFDVETTGLDPAVDEIVEIAAVRPDGKGGVERFHRYVRPTRPVGASEEIHGLGDELLARKGVEPREAFEDFLAFAEGRRWVGHNVRFDIAMLRSHAARAGLDLPPPPHDDTLDLARRFVRDVERHDLRTLAERFGLETLPTHRASDDVAATHALLARLGEAAAAGAPLRRRLVRRYGAAFRGLADLHERFLEASWTLRPPDLLEKVLDESGLRAHYARDRERSQNLERLLAHFRRLDRPEVPPHAELEELVTQSALSRFTDLVAAEGERVPLITVHQAKGLEFDAVFVVGMEDETFPSFFSRRDGDLEEERRLFYVAATRARRKLFLTWVERDENGRRRRPSRFLEGL